MTRTHLAVLTMLFVFAVFVIVTKIRNSSQSSSTNRRVDRQSLVKKEQRVPNKHKEKRKEIETYDQILQRALRSPEFLEEEKSQDDETRVSKLDIDSVDSRQNSELFPDSRNTVTAPVLKRYQDTEDVQSLYFWSDFASLRTDAVRNPDSPQNRAVHNDIVKMRKARLKLTGQ